jgi:hypothetical protein
MHMSDEDGTGATIYRFYAADALVYLGVTGYLPGRLGCHAKRNWWRSCDRMTLTHYGTREEAEAAETAAIRAERPLYNVLHNYDAPAVGPWEDKEQCMEQHTEQHMNTIASRVFQINYQRLVEPVVVKAKSRTLGTWFPHGTEDLPTALPETDAYLNGLVEEIRHLKAELAKPSVETFAPKTAVRAGLDRTRNNAPFTPVKKVK